MKKWLNSLTFKERIAISYGVAGLAVIQTFIEIILGQFLLATVGIFTFLFLITLTLIAQHQNWFRSPRGKPTALILKKTWLWVMHICKGLSFLMLLVCLAWFLFAPTISSRIGAFVFLICSTASLVYLITATPGFAKEIYQGADPLKIKKNEDRRK